MLVKISTIRLPNSSLAKLKLVMLVVGSQPHHHHPQHQQLLQHQQTRKPFLSSQLEILAAESVNSEFHTTWFRDILWLVFVSGRGGSTAVQGRGLLVLDSARVRTVAAVATPRMVMLSSENYIPIFQDMSDSIDFMSTIEQGSAGLQQECPPE